MNPQLTERTYRYVVTFKPDRPMRPASYTREVVIGSLYHGDAIRAALECLGVDSDGRDITFWQADEVAITVRRSA